MLRFGMVLLASTLSSALSAQNPVSLAYSEFSTVPAELKQQPNLDRKINLDLNNVQLNRAIQVVADRAAVKIAFGEPVDQSHHIVTLNRKGLTLREALDVVLHGTGLHYRTLGEQIVVEPSIIPILEEGVITGRILHSKSKQPIAGAIVALEGTQRSVTTSSDGTFRIVTLPGEFTLTVRSVGMARVARKVTVAHGKSLSVEIVMESSASVLGEVVVTGTVVETERKAVPTPITVITAEDIEKRGIARLEQLFRGEVPGLLALDKGTTSYNSELRAMVSSAIFSRGSASLNGTGNPIKTYVDGVELLDPTYLGTIDPQSIERIEIVTGPQAATIYGSGAMGGVMQIFTKRGSGTNRTNFILNLGYVLMESNLSSTKTPKHIHSASVSGGTGPAFSFSGNVSYDYSGQWRPGLFVRSIGGAIGVTTQLGNATMSGSVALTSGRNGTAGTGNWQFTIIPGALGGPTLLERGWMEEGIVDVGSNYLSMFASGAQPVSTSSSQTMSLNVDYRSFQWWQHHVTLGRATNAFALIPQSPRFWHPGDSLHRSSESSGGRVTLSGNSTIVGAISHVSSTLTLGANSSDAYNTEISGCLLEKQSANYIACDEYSPLNTGKLVGGNTWGGFASTQIGIAEQLFFSFGIRGERNPNYGKEHKTDWTPTVGATYTVEVGNLTVKWLASYGRATRAPGPSQRLAGLSYRRDYADPAQYIEQLPAPDLAPEYSRGPQGGVEIYVGNLFSATVNHYQQKISGMLQPVVIDSIWLTYNFDASQGFYGSIYQWMNVGSIRQYGWEITSNANVGPLSLKGTYSWNDSRILALHPRAAFVWLQEGSSFNNLPTHTGNVMATYALGGSRVSLIANFIGRSPTSSVYTQGFVLRQSARAKMYVTSKSNYNPPIIMPAYSKADLLLSQRIRTWVDVKLNVTNLTGNFDSEAGNLFPSLGRQTLLGITVRLPK